MKLTLRSALPLWLVEAHNTIFHSIICFSTLQDYIAILDQRLFKMPTNEKKHCHRFLFLFFQVLHMMISCAERVFPVLKEYLVTSKIIEFFNGWNPFQKRVIAIITYFGPKFIFLFIRNVVPFKNSFDNQSDKLFINSLR